MKQYFFPILFSITLFLLSSAGLQAQTITGSIGNGAVARGSSTRASVALNIPGGLHVNSSRPNSQYAIATTVRVSGQGVKTSSVKYPAGHNRKFNFSETAINVYEGNTVFPFTVNVPANFRGDTVRLRAVVRYQACTTEVCYPPKTKEITLTARVR
jgi:DsbC/DsbD-like thiol-disulfide interchange protein